MKKPSVYIMSKKTFAMPKKNAWTNSARAKKHYNIIANMMERRRFQKV